MSAAASEKTLVTQAVIFPAGQLWGLTQDVQAALFGPSLIAPLKLNNGMRKPSSRCRFR